MKKYQAKLVDYNRATRFKPILIRAFLDTS